MVGLGGLFNYPRGNSYLFGQEGTGLDGGTTPSWDMVPKSDKTKAPEYDIKIQSINMVITGAGVFMYALEVNCHPSRGISFRYHFSQKDQIKFTLFPPSQEE